MWRLYRKPKEKVARVSTERDNELHSCNSPDPRLAAHLIKTMKEQGHPVRTGRWLPGEDRILIKNVRKYRKDNPDLDPIEMLHSKLDKKLKRIVMNTQFYSRIAAGTNRTVCAAFRRLSYVLFPSKDIKKGNYMQEESDQLQRLYMLYGPRWKRIGAQLGRSERSVAVKWHNSDRTKTGIWTKDEDEALLQAVKKFLPSDERDNDMHDVKQWSQIAREVPGRNMFQCRIHWLIKLRSTVMCAEHDLETIKWGYKEKVKLLKMISEQTVCHEEDIDFDVLRKKFQKKGFVTSSIQIRRQWRNLKTMVKNYYIKSFEEILDDLSEIFYGSIMADQQK